MKKKYDTLQAQNIRATRCSRLTLFCVPPSSSMQVLLELRKHSTNVSTQQGGMQQRMTQQLRVASLNRLLESTGRGHTITVTPVLAEGTYFT